MYVYKNPDDDINYIETPISSISEVEFGRYILSLTAYIYILLLTEKHDASYLTYLSSHISGVVACTNI